MTVCHKDRYYWPTFKAKKQHISQTGKQNKQSQRPNFVIIRAVNTAVQTRNEQWEGGEGEQENRKADWTETNLNLIAFTQVKGGIHSDVMLTGPTATWMERVAGNTEWMHLSKCGANTKNKVQVCPAWTAQIRRVHTFRTKSPLKRFPLSEYPYWRKFNCLFFHFFFFFNIRTVRHTGSVFSFRVPASQSLLKLQKKNFVFFVKTLHIVKSSKNTKWFLDIVYKKGGSTHL